MNRLVERLRADFSVEIGTWDLVEDERIEAGVLLLLDELTASRDGGEVYMDGVEERGECDNPAGFFAIAVGSVAAKLPNWRGASPSGEAP